MRSRFSTACLQWLRHKGQKPTCQLQQAALEQPVWQLACCTVHAELHQQACTLQAIITTRQQCPHRRKLSTRCHGGDRLLCSYSPPSKRHKHCLSRSLYDINGFCGWPVWLLCAWVDGAEPGDCLSLNFGLFWQKQLQTTFAQRMGRGKQRCEHFEGKWMVYQRPTGCCKRKGRSSKHLCRSVTCTTPAELLCVCKHS